jgi:hypothetical protein
MRVEFSEHAERKIKQRKLQKSWIRKTLSQPEFVYSSYGNRQIAYRKFKKLYLAVVFKEESDRKIVITTHWEKKFKPKIKEDN